ncbi:MAG: hypothetical protein ACRC7N_19090 [Clostridium sp.]
MIFYIELLILAIGILIFSLQKKNDATLENYSKKLVYWTVLLFISIMFNGIQFSKYPSAYSIDTYMESYLVHFIIMVVAVFTIVQILSPSKLIKRIKKYFDSNGKKKSVGMKEPSPIQSRDKEFREEQFESFLNTICWISIINTVILEGLMTNLNIGLENEWSIINSVCIISVVAIPIILREIIFYVVKIKNSTYKNKYNEREGRLNRKITNINNRL